MKTIGELNELSTSHKIARPETSVARSNLTSSPHSVKQHIPNLRHADVSLPASLDSSLFLSQTYVTWWHLLGAAILKVLFELLVIPAKGLRRRLNVVAKVLVL